MLKREKGIRGHRIFLLGGLSVLVVILMNGCYKDKAEKLYPGPIGGTVCDTLAMKYASDIQPIYTAHCALAGCHTTADKASAGGYAFDSYAETMVSVTNGRMLMSIKYIGNASKMPKGLPQLESCDINKISAWVNQGAKNN